MEADSSLGSVAAASIRRPEMKLTAWKRLVWSQTIICLRKGWYIYNTHTLSIFLHAKHIAFPLCPRQCQDLFRVWIWISFGNVSNDGSGYCVVRSPQPTPAVGHVKRTRYVTVTIASCTCCAHQQCRLQWSPEIIYSVTTRTCRSRGVALLLVSI